MKRFLFLKTGNTCVLQKRKRNQPRNMLSSHESKKGGEGQEMTQLSTTPDPKSK